MKGIVLAGGTGSRLWPLTVSTSKQLLPIYDKPLIYYPLSVLMQGGIREILIIVTPHDEIGFRKLLGDGSQFGIQISYQTQPKPEGIAQAFLIASDFIGADNVTLILGDNLFHSYLLAGEIQSGVGGNSAKIFTYEVSNPQDYGVIKMDENNHPIEIIEKPSNPNSNLAVTGIYIYDNSVVEYARELKPSDRNELEITDLNKRYLDEKSLSVIKLGRGTAWLDTGHANHLHDAASYVRVIEERTGTKIGCLEEVAFLNGWINEEQLRKQIDAYGKSLYGNYLSNLLARK